MNKLWPFWVKYPRTTNWYDTEWVELSEWCNNTVGKGQWEYFSPYFLFKDEKHKLWFMLKWS